MKRKLTLFFFFATLFSFSTKAEFSDWHGTWEKFAKDSDNPATLTISNSDPTTSFSVESFNGAHVGKIHGQLVFTEKHKAHYILTEDCRLDFKKTNLLIFVSEMGCERFKSAMVSFDGTYKFISKDLPQEKDTPSENPVFPKDTLTKNQVFPNQDYEKIFIELVGENYDAFAMNTQLVSQETHPDSPKRKVVTTAVRGLFTILENIFIYDENKNIWAANLNGPKNQVLYFTNVKKEENTLPKEIEKWRSRFDHVPVIYASAK